MNILEARNLRKEYSLDQRRLTVLDDISLSIAAGEFVVISGSSGSGKTTLLTLLSGLDQPTSGNVILDGKRLEISEQRIELLQAQLEREQKRNEVGVGDLVQVYNFQSQLANENLNNVNLQNQYKRFHLL